VSGDRDSQQQGILGLTPGEEQDHLARAPGPQQQIRICRFQVRIIGSSAQRRAKVCLRRAIVAEPLGHLRAHRQSPGAQCPRDSRIETFGLAECTQARGQFSAATRDARETRQRGELIAGAHEARAGVTRCRVVAAQLE